MKVKVKSGKPRLVITIDQDELDIINTALTLVYSSDKYGEENRNFARIMQLKLPVNIEDLV